MPARIPDRKRARIVADIKAEKPRNQIARDHGVSPSTVTLIARQAGLGSAFDRSKTLKASRAKAIDNKAKRAQLASDLLDDAQKLRARAWEPYPVPMMGPEGAETVELTLPPLPDVRAAYTAIGIQVDKGLAIERHDKSDDGVDHAKSMLGQLLTGLAEVVGQDPAPARDAAE
jgi:transposase-like protein